MDQMTIKTKVSEGGRIVLPAKLREAAGIKVGGNVTITLKNGGLQITTRDQAILRIQEVMKKYIVPGRSVVDELIAERREEAKND